MPNPKCRTCKNETIVADAGIMKSIPYFYCRTCKIEVKELTEQENTLRQIAEKYEEYAKYQASKDQDIEVDDDEIVMSDLDEYFNEALKKLDFKDVGAVQYFDTIEQLRKETNAYETEESQTLVYHKSLGWGICSK